MSLLRFLPRTGRVVELEPQDEIVVDIDEVGVDEVGVDTTEIPDATWWPGLGVGDDGGKDVLSSSEESEESEESESNDASCSRPDFGDPGILCKFLSDGSI